MRNQRYTLINVCNKALVTTYRTCLAIVWVLPVVAPVVDRSGGNRVEVIESATSFCSSRPLPGQSLIFTLIYELLSLDMFCIESTVSKYYKISKKKKTNILLLVIRLAKLDDTNKACFENIIYLSYLIP